MRNPARNSAPISLEDYIRLLVRACAVPPIIAAPRRSLGVDGAAVVLMGRTSVSGKDAENEDDQSVPR